MPNPFPLPTPAKRLMARAPHGSVKFLSVGVTGLAVHSLLFTALFRGVGLGDTLSWLIALGVATLVTWTLNRRLTFAPSGRGHLAEALRYVLVTAVSQGISYGVFLGLGVEAPHLPRTLALIVGAGVATVFSYTGQRFFTFAAPKTITGEPVISDIPVA